MNTTELKKLTEGIGAGFALVADLVGSVLGDDDRKDPRVLALQTLAEQLNPPPERPRPDCPHCGKPRAEMVWHPAESHDECPRCGKLLPAA